MLAVIVLLAGALAQQPPAPAPFPRAGTQQPARPVPPGPAQPAPAEPALTPAPTPAPPSSSANTAETGPDATQLGVQLYPGSQFLASYDAGRGQRYYLFGTAASFIDVVAYYRNILRQRGDLVFDAPATHQFDLGRFREDTMAFPPSVTVKEFQSAVSPGYPNPRPNGQPARFPTVIQVVPNPAPER